MYPVGAKPLRADGFETEKFFRGRGRWAERYLTSQPTLFNGVRFIVRVGGFLFEFC